MIAGRAVAVVLDAAGAVAAEVAATVGDFRAARARHRARAEAFVERHAPLVPDGHPWTEPGRANEWAAAAAEQDEARTRRDASTRGGDCE